MESTGLQGNGSSSTSLNESNGEGNDQLSQAFDKAIAEAQKTLATTTVKGADLYALKQSVR
ncbi:MAG: hypothetical protein AAF217_13895 [Pseudomonadota bacterium]